MKSAALIATVLLAVGAMVLLVAPWIGPNALQAEEVPVMGARHLQAAARNDSLLLDVGEVLDDFLSHEPYFYQSAGLRDPFAPLLVAGAKQLADGPIDVDDLIVVGILWGARDRFALVQTPGGRSMILRQGDRISNGRVTAVSLDGITVRVSHYGVVKTVTLPVTSGVEGRDER